MDKEKLGMLKGYMNVLQEMEKSVNEICSTELDKVVMNDAPIKKLMILATVSDNLAGAINGLYELTATRGSNTQPA